MKIQLVYRCRLCRQDEVRDASAPLGGLDRKAFDYVVLHEMDGQVIHDCTPSGTHRGLCDLAGVVVTEES